MSEVYQKPFAVTYTKDLPDECEKPTHADAIRTGYRIGFDAGGSDRKVTACINDKVVFEKEIIWHPKLQSDIQYHIDGVADSINQALAALGGRVDAIGVSSAGIVVHDEMRVASLFRKVPADQMQQRGAFIYKNLAKTYGCPVKVANDGDVAALAGAFQLGQGKVVGIAMGTSLAGGFVDENMNIKGYLNELAFVPVDSYENAPQDEWSGDLGVGTSYHSQDAVIRLAPHFDIPLTAGLSPAELLKEVQALTEAGDARGEKLFETLGEYFGYSLLWYTQFYHFDQVVFMGRVASGKGGDILLENARRIIAGENAPITITLPDEMSRRLGQSYTATLL